MKRRFLLAGLLAAIVLGAEDAEARRQSRRRRASSTRSRRAPRSGGSRFAVGGADYYPNCAAARAAGAAPIRSGDPGYSRRLDRDGDGIACE